MSQIKAKANVPKKRGLSQKWKKIVNTSVPIVKDFGHIKPAVRTILYQLDGMGLLDKSNKNHSDQLSSHLVDARKEGLIDWDALSDNARVLLGKVPEHQTIDEYLEMAVDHIKYAAKKIQVSQMVQATALC